MLQEVRAEHAIAALGRMAAPTAHVYRDGSLQVVPAAELVPGDLLRLEAVRQLFGTEPVTGSVFVTLLGLSVVPGLVVWLGRLGRRRR